MFLLCGGTTSQGNKEPVICCTAESTVCCTVWSVLLGPGLVSARSEPPLIVALAPQWDPVQTVSLGLLMVQMEEPGQPPARHELLLLQLYWSGLIGSPEIMRTALALVPPGWILKTPTEQVAVGMGADTLDGL